MLIGNKTFAHYQPQLKEQIILPLMAEAKYLPCYQGI